MPHAAVGAARPSSTRHRDAGEKTRYSLYMDESVKVEIEVTREAAAALQDETRRRSIGRLVSEIVKTKTVEEHPLARLFAEIKRDARAAQLTDEEIDAELTTYNAERRS